MLFSWMNEVRLYAMNPSRDLVCFHTLISLLSLVIVLIQDYLECSSKAPNSYRFTTLTLEEGKNVDSDVESNDTFQDSLTLKLRSRTPN